MKQFYLTSLMLLIGLSQLSAQEDELAAIKRAVDTLYSSLSFEEGGRADTALFLSIFLEDGILINNNRGNARVISPKAFAESISQIEGLKSFKEYEIYGETLIFGTIAHRFSTYDKYTEVGERVISGKGINSFQLVKVDGRWMVNSITWNDETEERKIPEVYQGK